MYESKSRAWCRRCRGGPVLVPAVVTLLLLTSAASVGAEAATQVAPGDVLRLTIDEAIGIALEHGHEIGVAEAAEAAARARLGQARAAFLPSVSASASYTRLDEVPYMDAGGFSSMFDPLMEPFQYLVEQGYLDPGTLEGLSGDGGSAKIPMGDDDIYSVGVSVTQPIFLGGVLLGAHGAARHGHRAAEYMRVRTEDETRYNVTRAYVALLQAKAGLGVMDDAVEQMEGYLSDLEAMYEEGMLLDANIMQARVQMSVVELDRNTAKHGTRLATAALAFAMGLDPGTEIEALDTLEREARPSLSLEGWTEKAMETRPDLKTMRESVGAADNAVGMARAEFFPQVMFVANLSWDRPNREYEPEFYDSWSVTLAAQMNVFDWGGRLNRVREAKAGYCQAEQGLRLMTDAVKLEVRQSLVALDESREAVEIARSGLDQAEESFRVTRESFQSGRATNTEVLNAQTALTTAEVNRIMALANLRIAEASLRLATGVMN